MSALSEMPVVTVEQVMRFRDAAIDIERQRGELLAALKNARAFIYGKPSAELPCGWEIDIDKAIAKASQQ